MSVITWVTLLISAAAFPRLSTLVDACRASATARLVTARALSVLLPISETLWFILSMADATNPTLVDACSLAAATEFIFWLISSAARATVADLSPISRTPSSICLEITSNWLADALTVSK